MDRREVAALMGPSALTEVVKAPVVLPNKHLHSLTGHKAAVLNLSFSHDGHHLMSSSQDKTCRLWNPHKGIHIQEYKDVHNYEVNETRIFYDKTKFVSVGGDKAGYLWDIGEVRVLRRFAGGAGHEGKINCCDLSMGDSVLATGSFDKRVLLWDLRSRHNRRPALEIKHAVDAITALQFRGHKLYTGSVDGCARTYDIRKGRLCVDVVDSPITSLALTANDECLLVACLDNTIKLLDLKNRGRQLNEYRGHRASNYRIHATFDPSNQCVVSGSEDGRLFFWEIDSLDKALEVWEGDRMPHRGSPVFCVRFAPNIPRTTLVSAGNNKTLEVYGVDSLC
ncbi:MAG: hypothetical protein KVP17_005233 [Porospora cf. gigantea B]|uniref:uncharacterized protein n=1 Tax=Porospora cf. gigantea B TaxID=2853592 RepID=UPI003571B115|nr:MAG: hypothetical protein KVP17_005233 [Porospora cf. gigantea B]